MRFTTQDIHKVVDAERQTAIEFLQKAVQIPSVTGNEKEISDFMRKWIEENIGLEVKVFEKEAGRPNLIAHWDGAEPGGHFLFNGHMDVFPPAQNDPGRFGPWSGKIEDGYIYGRGTSDMKGGTCATIMAVYFLKKMGYTPKKGRVTLSCMVDEENGGHSGVAYLLDQGELKADYGVCPEPTHHRVLCRAGGGFWAAITYHAESYHASLDVDRLDAIQKAHRAMEALYAYDKKLKKERYYAPFGQGPVCSVTMISGGETENMHPSTCTFKIDRRLVPGESLEGAKQEVIELLEQLKAEDPSMEYQFEQLTYTPQYDLDSKHKLVQSAFSAYEAIMGRPTGLLERTGGSDAHKIVERYPDCCIPNFGPSVEGESCTPNEKLKLDDYISFIKIFMQMVIDLQS